MAADTHNKLSFRQRHPTLVRAVLLTFTFLVALGAGTLYSSWALICRGNQCPSIEILAEYTPHQTSKLYAIDGRFIAELGLERRTLVKIDEIPKIVQDAFVATEDKRFYSHAGIDWHRATGVILRSPIHGFSQGFSTITMQLARNVFPEKISREKSLIRKLKEAKVAREIETKYDKKKILELYLNQIDLGHGAYGVETASQRYFGKSVRDLNLAEAATLAALPKAPARYNPVRYPERAIQRRNTVIGLMRDAGYISEADWSRARAYPLQLASKSVTGETAPYFVEWVRQQLDAQFGKQLYEQGLKVFTTLDLDAQSAAERALERQAVAIEAGRFGPYKHETFEHYMAHREGDVGSGTSPYLQSAFLALDPRNGAVRAMIGGRDFDDSKFNRSVQALRQPGSAFKPIVYSAAVQNGRPASYIVNDSPLVLQVPGQPEWAPQNYDLQFLGQIPMRQSLYQSRNVATIRLGMELGEQTVINEARNFGITTVIPPYPSIHIGAADVYPIELISAYTAFANLGVRASPNAIIRVENQKGEILWQPTPTRTQVLSPEESWIMVDMMKDVVRRGTAAGSVWGAGFHYPAGGKTGTTNDGTNVWFIGYTADLVAGAWMGFDRPQKIKDNAQGGVLAAPAWTAFMTEVYRRKPPPPDWPKPISIVTREIDISSGLLQTPYCPRNLVTSEFYISGTEPTRDCDKHLAYGTPGYAPIDTFSTLPPSTSGGIQPPIRVTPPTIQPGYEPVPSRNQPRTPTVFDTTTRRPPPNPSALRDSIRRDSLRRDSLRRRTDTIPSAARAPR
ncbi:MAG: PBP1A family penicillin-binding protein [Gemmatimonadota bacterium]|nr:PBP1A family penicillin-binding protein [Gemmatimonadota bacterium]